MAFIDQHESLMADDEDDCFLAGKAFAESGIAAAFSRVENGYLIQLPNIFRPNT